MKKLLTLTIFASLFGTGLLAQNQVPAVEITPDRKHAIDSLALEKVRDLSKYISIIGDKTTPWSDAQRVIERACELFMDGAEIGVSSINRPDQVSNFKIREYFDRLMQLNYSKVVIDWYKIQYVSDLERQPDGTFVGVITVYQKFQGYDKEKGLVYEDTTKKDITIYVKRKETQIGGRLIGFWDVMLGDIRVKETSKK
jgi:hypothetical protein